MTWAIPDVCSTFGEAKERERGRKREKERERPRIMCLDTVDLMPDRILAVWLKQL